MGGNRAGEKLHLWIGCDTDKTGEEKSFVSKITSSEKTGELRRNANRENFVMFFYR